MKSIEIPEVGEVILSKSKRAKRIILKINKDGVPHITIPSYVPYIAAKQFALRQSQWIQSRLTEQPRLQLRDGMQIGLHHTLRLQTVSAAKTVTTRVTKEHITVSHPEGYDLTSVQFQKTVATAAKRALRRQAEQFLPPKLHTLATAHGYSYKEVRIKDMHTRWGSCSSGKVINLSIWLMQLPEDLIEYVLCHELAHLRHMNHSREFWLTVSEMVPRYAAKRRKLKEYSPRLMQA